MKRSVWISVAVFSLLCSLWVPSALGQAVYGSILGTVTDPSGAAVSGAKVTVTSQTKNVSTEATTNDSGNYSVTHLIPDVYAVRIEGSGFKTLEFKDIQVSARHRHRCGRPIPGGLRQRTGRSDGRSAAAEDGSRRRSRSSSTESMSRICPS